MARRMVFLGLASSPTRGWLGQQLAIFHGNVNPTNYFTWPIITLVGIGGISLMLMLHTRKRKPVYILHNGCRTEFGPLELRIQTTESENGYTVFVEDHRREPFCVMEESILSTLESAKQHLTLKAGEYLAAKQDPAHYVANWRCS